MSSGTLTLFDIPSKEPRRCWSLNTWRTRILLNYKGIDYKTEWLEYHEIKSRLEKHVSPGPDGGFTCPAVIWPDGSYLMDSRSIADAINDKYPDPPLEIEPPVHQRLMDPVAKAFPAMRAIFLKQVYARVLDDASRPYFAATRAQALGQSIEQFVEANPEAEAYAAIAPHLEVVSGLLRENDGGPFLMGEKPVYTDFVWASILLFFKSMGEDVWESYLASTGDAGLHLKLLEAMGPWIARDDH